MLSSVANVTYRGWYGTASPASLCVVDMLARLLEMTFNRVRWATIALVLMSSEENISNSL
jgi:hypothetical protein